MAKLKVAKTTDAIANLLYEGLLDVGGCDDVGDLTYKVTPKGVRRLQYSPSMDSVLAAFFFLWCFELGVLR